MKHAILIMAHKDVGLLCHLIEYFQEGCDVFIHLDKKVGWGHDIIEFLKGYRQVRLVSTEHEVNWGGTSVLESELSLLQTAYGYDAYDYFHLISGQDYPVKPLSYFLDFFERNKGKEFLQWIHIPSPRWERNTYRRFQYFYPYDMAQGRENPRAWVSDQVAIQMKKGIKRPIPDEFDVLYGSSQWFSITQKAAKVLLEYTREHPKFYNRLWMTFAPEECYVATVLLNKLDQNDINQGNCRFIRWRYENGNRPANLGIEHFRHLLGDDLLFARKIDRHCSMDLRRLVDDYLVYAEPEVKITASGGWNYDGYLAFEYDNLFCEQVMRLYSCLSIKNAVDIGCGPGYYVAMWRERGLSFAGYDSNPHTRALSSRLLPDGDMPCGIADITGDLTAADTFELVVCNSVLPYIPQSKLDKAISNLASLSSACILVGNHVPDKHGTLVRHGVDGVCLIAKFKKRGFSLNKYLTSTFQRAMGRKDYYIFTK